MIPIDCKFVTHIGWRPDSKYDLMQELYQKNISQYLIEIWPPNVQKFRHPGVRKFCRDVRHYRECVTIEHRDVVIWQNGPEQLPMDEAKVIIRHMQDDFNCIILSIGYIDPYESYGNDSDVIANNQHWTQDDYKELGFDENGIWINPNRREITALPFVNNTKLQLPDVTLVCIDTCYYNPSVNILYWNLQQCEFGKVILFTDHDIFDTGITEKQMTDMGVEMVMLPSKIAGKVGPGSYSDFTIKKLASYIETSHILITQQDGYIKDTSHWDWDFLDYDYIGSKWYFYDLPMNVGNGGFSLRSTRLHQLLASDSKIDHMAYAEDTYICRAARPYLEYKYQLRYATYNVANRFTYDTPPVVYNTFGFHQVDTKGYELQMAAKYGYLVNHNPR